MLASGARLGRRGRTGRLDVQLNCACAGQQQGRGAYGPDNRCELHGVEEGASVYAIRRRRRVRSGSSTGPDDVALHSAARMQSAYFNSRVGRRCGGEAQGNAQWLRGRWVKRATGPGRRRWKRQARGVDGEGGRFRGVVGLNERVHVRQGHGGSAGELVARPSQESGRAGSRLVDGDWQIPRRSAGEQAPWRPKGTQAGIGLCYKRHMKQLPAHAPRRAVFYARIERLYQALLREASQPVCVLRRSADALEGWAGGQNAAARLRGTPASQPVRVRGALFSAVFVASRVAAPAAAQVS
jgi:hypothetical protein